MNPQLLTAPHKAAGDPTKAYALPAPLTTYIFSLLDVPSLVACGRVCTTWKVSERTQRRKT